MAYKTLYRVYRPQRFDEVAGQEHIITTLRHAVRKIFHHIRHLLYEYIQIVIMRIKPSHKIIIQINFKENYLKFLMR